MNPKISIIIPVYKVEEYIGECISSIIKQTYSGYMECLIIDDCSPDKSIEKAKEIISKYKGKIDFRIITHRINKGLSAARNTGIKEATGDYVFFLDSDDYIIPECINLMVNVLIRYPEVELVQGGTIYNSGKHYYNVTSKEIKSYYNNNIQLRRLLLRKDTFPVTAWNKLVSKKFIIRYSLYFKEGIIHEDEHWLFFISKYISSLAICPFDTYIYRVRENSIMFNNKLNTNSLKSWSIIINDMINNIDKKRDNEDVYFILKQLHKLIVFCNDKKYKTVYINFLHRLKNECKNLDLIYFLIVRLPFFLNKRRLIYKLLIDDYLLFKVRCQE